MDFWQILMMPFSSLLKLFCTLFNSYGVALIFFTILVKLVLSPLSYRGKKSMIKTTLLSGQMKEIQERCGNDRERYTQEVQRLYEENNVSPMGGCGWSMLPLLILMPLYSIIRRPLTYLMGLSSAGVQAAAGALGTSLGSDAYAELTMASMMNAGNLSQVTGAVEAAGLSAAGVFVINFNFLGLDLSAIPNLMFWKDGLSWGSVGLFLLPVVSAVFSYLSMMVSQKTNIMNRNQEQDSTMAATNRTMMLISPLMSLWIGFTLPAGLCVYWIANSLLMMAQEVIFSRMLRGEYEKAQAEIAEQMRRSKAAEKERRRIAAEKKAAAIAAGTYKKGGVKPHKEKGADVSASREGMRTYARGRAYDPNRYPITPYWDPNAKSSAPDSQGEDETPQAE
ncbi:MAG TPA: insertase [Clostridiales bacterium]|nr:insertase [Clostridiales bacterium]